MYIYIYIYITIKRIFNTVNHDILLANRELYGARTQVNSCLELFLKYRNNMCM